MGFQPARPQRDIATTEAHFEADIRLRLAPWRLTAHSPRQLDMMRALARLGATPRKATALDVVETLSAHPEIAVGAVPAKIEIEPTSRTDHAPFYLREYLASQPQIDLAPETFAKVVEALGPHRDVLLTLEGLGEPLLHPDLAPLIATAKAAGIMGVHLGTGGRLLDESAVERLTQARLDLLSVHVGAHTPESYELLFGAPGLHRVQAHLESAFKARPASGHTWPLYVAEITKIRPLEGDIEPFVDFWRPRADATLIRPYNDFAGQIEDIATIHMRTSKRIPCRKIFTEMYVDAEGIAWPCRQDIHRTRPLGNITEQSPADLWRGDFLEKLRSAHLAGDYDFFPLCRNCRDSYYSL
jgi:hypothetical protein